MTLLDKPDLDKGLIFVIVFFSLLISLIGTISLIALTNSSNFQKDRMKIAELLITNLDFTVGDASTGKIIIQAINSGDFDVTVSEIKVNNETANSWEATNPTVTTGATETFTITHEITAGNKYYIWLFSTDGQLVGSYTKTA